MLPEAPPKALPPSVAALVTPAFWVTLPNPAWLTNTSASAMPKLKDASAADSDAALSCALLSPDTTLKPRLPDAPAPTLSPIEARLVTRLLLVALLLIDWRLSITAMAAESRSMSPVMVGSPEKLTSVLRRRSFSRFTSTP
ncbi:hypothetical protein G6F23_014847 [Rhizopus arrhizus]|nr:hypothetical protein G6F23_014847 [Rhizopus arrhizus]